MVPPILIGHEVRKSILKHSPFLCCWIDRDPTMQTGARTHSRERAETFGSPRDFLQLSFAVPVRRAKRDGFAVIDFSAKTGAVPKSIRSEQPLRWEGGGII
jgi:hypothetical protein